MKKKYASLSIISHELRTPLTLIHAPLSRIIEITLLRRIINNLPLKAIYRQSQRMKNLINMVLDVRKMEVGESKMQIQLIRSINGLRTYHKTLSVKVKPRMCESVMSSTHGLKLSVR